MQQQRITFFCNEGDYPPEDLKKFSENTGAKVVIRGVAIIDSGKMKMIN